MSSVLSDNRFSPITPDDIAGSIWIATLLCLVYSALVMAVRAHLRRKVYVADDYLIMAATLLHFGEGTAVIIGLRYGIGQTISLLNPDDVSVASQSIFAAQILFIGSSCFAKCSALYLMMRLFNLHGPWSQKQGMARTHWAVCIGMLGFMALWGIGSTFGLSVDCSSKNFIKASEEGQCSNQVLRWRLVTAFDVATEFFLNFMSIIIVIPVQISFHLKFQVVFAFLFRLPLVALSILRLYYVGEMMQSSNPGLAIGPILIIQQVYICWSILSATIPNLKAFVRSFSSGFVIGIDMEAYASGHGSRGTGSNGHELGSVRSNGLVAPKTALRIDNSPNDEEHVIVLPNLRVDGRRIPKNDGASTGSEDSQRQIIRKNVQ